MANKWEYTGVLTDKTITERSYSYCVIDDKLRLMVHRSVLHDLCLCDVGGSVRCSGIIQITQPSGSIYLRVDSIRKVKNGK